MKFKLSGGFSLTNLSHLAWGAWIEIGRNCKYRTCCRSHLAWGAWIEMLGLIVIGASSTSHLAWGAWIEIIALFPLFARFVSHLAWGAWIEIYRSSEMCIAKPRRTSHGVRGLKSYSVKGKVFERLSHLAWGAWIEMGQYCSMRGSVASHLAWGAWIEIKHTPY